MGYNPPPPAVPRGGHKPIDDGNYYGNQVQVDEDAATEHRIRVKATKMFNDLMNSQRDGSTAIAMIGASMLRDGHYDPKRRIFFITDIDLSREDNGKARQALMSVLNDRTRAFTEDPLVKMLSDIWE